MPRIPYLDNDGHGANFDCNQFTWSQWQMTSTAFYLNSTNELVEWLRTNGDAFDYASAQLLLPENQDIGNTERNKNMQLTKQQRIIINILCYSGELKVETLLKRFNLISDIKYDEKLLRNDMDTISINTGAVSIRSKGTVAYANVTFGSY